MLHWLWHQELIDCTFTNKRNAKRSRMEGANACPLIYSDPHGTIWIPVDGNIIENTFGHPLNLQNRLIYQRYFSSAIRYLQLHHLPIADPSEWLNNISLLLDAAANEPCRRIDDEKSARAAGTGRSLLQIIDSVRAHEPFSFGPVQQRTGEAKDECRFICIFCHRPFTRTSDLRSHLLKNHEFSSTHIKQIFDKNDSDRLRVFGQYSYDDVKMNRWDIAEWKPRRSRGSQATAGEEPPTSSQKRKNRRRTPQRSPQPYADSPGEESPSMKRRQSSTANNHTTTASQAMLFGELSTVTTSWCRDGFQLELPNSSFDNYWPGDGVLSMASSVISSEALAQVGSSSEQQDVDTPWPIDDNTHTIYLSSDAPLIDSLARPLAIKSTMPPRYPPQHVQRGGRHRHH